MTTSTSEPHEPPTRTGLERVPGGLISFGCAVVLVVLVFPEIFFGGGSFSAIPLDRAAGQGHPQTVTLVPNLGVRPPTSGMVDLGARAWQLEPTTRYMANILRNGSNPDWNPYLASGELGPETLDGMQLSPVVLFIAALGGSSTAYTVGLMALMVLALYCLLQFFTRTLGMHRLAGIGAGVVFLLSGWATSTLGDVTGIPYLMFPIVLYALTEFQRRRGPGRFALAVAAYASLFASTFSPGQGLDVLLITVVAVVIDLWRRRESDREVHLAKRAVSEVGRQAVVPGVAVLTIAVILLPALDAYRHAGSDVTSYSQQFLATLSPQRWLLVPTYVTAPLQSVSPTAWTVEYLGIAPLVLTAAAWPRVRGLSRWLLGALSILMVFGLAEHLGVPGLRSIGGLPGLRVIVNAYWASLAAASLALAFGVAVDTAVRRGLSYGVVVALGAATVVMMVGATAGAGDHGPAVLAAVVIAIVVECLLALVWLARRGLISSVVLGALAVALVALELGAYANHTRTVRSQTEAPPAAFVQYLQRNAGDGRVFDVGSSTLQGDWAAALGLREVGTDDIMQIPAYRAFYEQQVVGAGTPLPGRFLQVGRSNHVPFVVDPNVLDLLSVRLIAVSDVNEVARRQAAARYPLVFHDPVARVSVFANPDAAPRAVLVPALADGPLTQSATGRLDYSGSVTHTTDGTLLAEARRAGIPGTARTPLPASAARITTDDSTKVTVAVDAPAPSVLVLHDSYQPNWTVSVNGRTAHVGPVDSVVRGVIVPAGRSVVVFHYHSTARAIGWVISLITVVALLVGCGLWAWRRRSQPDRQSDAPAL